MGLDMYLSRKKYIWSDKRKDIKITGVAVKADKVKEITEEVLYWRKANAIHKWFVDNVQKGNDDCKEYYVDKEQLKSLLDLVNKVLKDHSKADDLLPTQEGFFFGGTEFDEYYFEDLENTKKGLEEVLADKDDGYEYYYQSSW